MAYHKIGNRVFYELLAIEFVRNLDKVSLKMKSQILYILACVDIDAGSILNTAHTICSSTLEVIRLQQES